MTSSYIKPILKETTISGGRDDCTHDAASRHHIKITRVSSGDEVRPFLALELEECGICGAVIAKKWLTAYGDYMSGMQAMIKDAHGETDLKNR